MASSTAAAAIRGGGSSTIQANPILGGMFRNNPAIQQMLAMNRFDNRTSAQNTAIANAADDSDPNNMSATGIGSSNIVQSNMIPPTPGMSEVGAPPTISSAVGNIPSVTTGGFTPQTQQVAQGIYGNENARQASVTKKPLINIL